MINSPPEDLPALLEDCWHSLARGASDRRSPLHQAVVATVTPEGAPDLRIMVLRLADPSQRLVQVHSDYRSDKIRHIEHDARGALLFYDPVAKVQIRVSGHFTLHRNDPIAETAWVGSQPMSRVCYAAPLAPGATVADPIDALGHLTIDPIPDGYPNFVVLRCHVTRLEWLYLAASGHRRARFELAESTPVGQWLAP